MKIELELTPEIEAFAATEQPDYEKYVEGAAQLQKAIKKAKEVKKDPRWMSEPICHTCMSLCRGYPKAECKGWVDKREHEKPKLPEQFNYSCLHGVNLLGMEGIRNLQTE